MSNFLQHKLNIEQWLDQLHGAIEQLEHCQLFDPTQASRWRQHWLHARTSLQEPLLRVAVVGAVKSGKSTLINVLTGCDLLKRGAGITTAFITRIMTNERLGGWIEFKSSSQVSQELNQVLRGLAIRYEYDCDETPLDVRKAQDLQRLTAIRDALQERLASSPASVDPNFILLNAYLQGHPLVSEHLADAITRMPLAGPKLHEHQRYVGQEAPAVFLHDIELHVPVPWLGDHLEIADCQGSDSPNPLHFAALQNYLLRSHFVVYLINGRTGLREADYRLLNLIKSLHMFPQTLFVFNIDLDLHLHVEDLNQLSQRVRTELGWFAPKAQFFAFSALYHLVQNMGEQAGSQERRRLHSWGEPDDLVDVTESGFAAFREALSEHVDRRRQQVLVGNAANRVALLARSIADSAATLQQFLAEDRDTMTRATQKLQERQKVFDTILTTLQQAIQGTHDGLLTELNAVIDRTFDLTSGPLVLETLALVDQFTVDPTLLEPLSSTVQVIQRVHSFYLQFRQNLWGTLVEKTNVKIIEFARNQEEWLQGCLNQAAADFWSLFCTTMEDYRQDLARLRLPLQPTPPPSDLLRLELDRASPPQFSAFVHRTPLTRPILLLKFGLGRLSQVLVDLKSRLGRQLPHAEQTCRQPSLDEALTLVKSETRTELLLAFRDYLRAFKHGYVFRLLDEACQGLLQEFQARAELAQIGFADALQHGAQHQEQHHALVSTLLEVQHKADAVRRGIDALGSEHHGD
jgi:hypothetical protein